MSDRPKRTRAGSNIVAPIDSQASDPDYMKKMLEAMVKLAVQHAGIPTNGKSPSVPGVCARYDPVTVKLGRGETFPMAKGRPPTAPACYGTYHLQCI